MNQPDHVGAAGPSPDRPPHHDPDGAPDIGPDIGTVGLRVQLVAKTEFYPPADVAWSTDADG
ncbi:MAG TPA: hypothetical protein VHH34_18680, partial [Pseudonocardiaceae bacterium]|nr:hypothetical protein [Pseudonocardiaceae bacterium]